MAYPALAQPGRIGALAIKNRIVVPAINNNYTQGARMTKRSIDCYAAKAKGGAGLVIVEATSVDYPRSRSVMNPALDRDDFMPEMRAIADVCHAEGAKTLVQLNHVGRQTRKSSSGMDPVAPSPIGGNSPLYPDAPKVLEIADIRAIIQKFADAALRAKRCGFDGVELNMGHGYLINNFLSPLSNRREDKYGGLQGGVRFAAEIVRAVKAACGAEFAIVGRINGDDFVQKDGNTIVECQLVAQQLEKAGADAISVTGGMRDSEQNFNDHCSGTPHGAWLPMAGRVKRVVNIPVIAVKRVTPRQAEEAVSSGVADFIAFGKQSVADPDFAQKLLAGHERDIIPCTSCCQGCYDRLWMWAPITCLLNPEAGKTAEEIARHRALRVEGRALVAGAGPAGLEAALELRRMGCEVVLAEQSDHLGGHYALCAQTERKAEVADAIAWFGRELEKAGVTVLLNHSLTAAWVSEQGFDLAVDATGARFARPQIPGAELPCVLSPEEALAQKDKLGNYVTILACPYGCTWTCHVTHHELPGDMVGTQTKESQACAAGFAAADLAEELTRLGKKVTILCERDQFAPGMGFTNRNYLLKRFFTGNVSECGGVRVRGVGQGTLQCEKDGVSFLLATDAVVYSQKLASDGAVCALLKEAGLQVYRVGDAERVQNALEAVHGAYRLAEKIAGQGKAPNQPC